MLEGADFDALDFKEFIFADNSRRFFITLPEAAGSSRTFLSAIAHRLELEVKEQSARGQIEVHVQLLGYAS